MYKRIIIKVGSKVISEAGRLNEDAVREIVLQVADLRKRGVEVIIVTSGATAAGKGHMNVTQPTYSISERQVYASVGQIGLMFLYAKSFNDLGLTCAQILVTKGDFRDREHYANIRNCFKNLLERGIIPVVNENDAIAISEQVFSDNDELAGLIASQLNADAVLILTSVDGVMVTENGETKVMPEVFAETADDVEKHIDSSISASGRGGMKTKFGIARKLMKQGIVTHILNCNKEKCILEVMDGKQVGTKFVPEGKLSAIKRRLAHADGFSAGAAYVNEGAEKILQSKTSCSLLPIGITKIEGKFKKGDIIEVKSETGKRIGYGIAQYSADEAREYQGKKGERELIHCDYLLIG